MNVTFIGGGNMASAIIGGLLSKGQPAKDIRVVEINSATQEYLKKQFAIVCFSASEKGALEGAQVIVLAVKPQHMQQVAVQLRPLLAGQIVLSIAAGIRLADLARWLGTNCTLVRAMPNTPALIGKGITGLIYYGFPAKNILSQDEIKLVEGITNAVGKSVWVRDEDEMNAVTAVSGSGPAYVFYFIEALEQAARELGLATETAHQLALSTFTGAAELAAQSSTEPVAALRERVTSKGGTTEAALESMAKDQVKEAIIRAIKAANERGRELGDELGKD